MGSWSVYCGLSNLTITSGQECVFLPLKKSNNLGGYLPYKPATLPIFGEYDDYGGIENIQSDKNTELIEKHFNCTIHDFCYFLTRGPIRDDEDDFPKYLKKVEEIQNWTYMWIDRKVYDFLVSNRNKSFGGIGDFDMGNETLLTHLGCTFIGKSDNNPTYDPKRYNQIWTYGEQVFYSDGTWMQFDQKDKDANVYGISGFAKKFGFKKELDDLKNKYEWEMWSIYPEEKVASLLFNVIGADGYNWNMKQFYKKIQKQADAYVSKLVDKYLDDYKTFGDLLCQLTSIRFNLSCMSHYWAPFVKHLTPQCGEKKEHQKILEKFAEINNEYVKEYGYDDEDEDE
jgi:hypothetical protein